MRLDHVRSRTSSVDPFTYIFLEQLIVVVRNPSGPRCVPSITLDRTQKLPFDVQLRVRMGLTMPTKVYINNEVTYEYSNNESKYGLLVNRVFRVGI